MFENCVKKISTIIVFGIITLFFTIRCDEPPTSKTIDYSQSSSSLFPSVLIGEEQNEEDRGCLEGQFECLHSHECLPMGWLCDDENDCGVVASSPSSINNNQTSTTNQSSSLMMLNFVDMSDEDAEMCKKFYHYRQQQNDTSNKSCQDLQCNSYGCFLNETTGFSQCQCPSEYVFDGTTCRSPMMIINQKLCQTEGHCDQLCEIERNATCSCIEGYRLDISGHKCLAINDPDSRPTFIVVSSLEDFKFFDQDKKVWHSIGLPETFQKHSSQIDETIIDTFGIDFSNQTICFLKKMLNLEQTLHLFDLEKNHLNNTINNQIFCTSFEKNSKLWSYRYIESSFFSSLFVHQMKFEWIGRNWYLVDTMNELIFVCDDHFRHCLDLSPRMSLSKPKSLEIDSLNRCLFAVEWGPNAYLKKFSLDGLEEEILVQKRIVYPSHLSLDIANQQVYWFDSYLETLERIDYNGQKRKLILKNPGNDRQRLINFDIFERKLYLLMSRLPSTEIHEKTINTFKTDSYFPQLVTIDVFNGSVVQEMDLNELTSIVSVVNRQRQPIINNGKDSICSTIEQQCQHLCLPLNQTTRKCFCASGFELLDDGHSCSNVLNQKQRTMLIYARARPGSIRLLSFDDTNKNFFQKGVEQQQQITISMVPLSRPVAVAFDSISQKLFYSNIQRYVINSFQLDLERPNQQYPAVFVDRGVIRAESLAIDWLGRNLYWTDSAMLTISVARIDEINSVVNSSQPPRKTLINTGLNNPKSIVLDHRNGYIYWTDWTLHANHSGRIERSWMNGIGRETVIGRGLTYPNGLTIDSVNGHIYWCDAYFKQIERSSLDGSERTMIYEGKKVGNPYSLAYYQNHLFWTDYRQGTLKSLNLLETKNRTIKTVLVDRSPLYDLKFIDHSVQKNVSNPCTDKKCEHLCLLIPSGAECQCSDGFFLNLKDQSTCQALPNYTRPSFCKKGEFECRRTSQCIDNRHVCDGDYDCIDGSDEDTGPGSICEKVQCKENYFRCDKNRCIMSHWVCDGTRDCIDGTDEQHFQNCTEIQCDSMFFKCHVSGRCIPRSWTCDSDHDCGAGDISDELENCSNQTSLLSLEGETTTEQPVKVNYIVRCNDDQFQCSNGDCVSGTMRCDGTAHCLDYSDELNCPNSKDSRKKNNEECRTPNRTCIDSKTNKTICLPIEKFCDNRFDCLDHIDESSMCADDLCFFSECHNLCHNVPFEPGFICYCPPGFVLALDGVSCTDAASHPCDQWGVCSQHCLRLQNGTKKYKCQCASGFFLDPADDFTCKSLLSFSPQILFSNRNQILSINLATMSSNVVLTGLKNSVALDYLYYGESDTIFVFWSDVVDDRLYRGELIQNAITNIETVVKGGLNFAEGLAVDWIGLNIYWVDSNFNQIEVARLDGSSRKTLLTENVSNPRAIALDPSESSMFWTDWDHDSPRIESAWMDGTDRKVVRRVAAGSWPNGLALDFVLKRIYWIDAKTDALSTIRYDGQDFRNILVGNNFLTHPFAISLYENFVYWSDWRTSSLVRANKWNGTKVEVIARTLTQPFDVKVLHPSRQLKLLEPSPCQTDNGGCSHLCLLSGGNDQSYSCACPHMMRLAEDKHNCTFNTVFLLLSKQNDVRGVELDRPNHFTLPPISLPKVLQPTQMDYVSSSRHIYWADAQLNEIKRFSLINGTIENILDTFIQQPLTFAIDWISQNLFVVSKRNHDFFSNPNSVDHEESSSSSPMTDEYEVIYEDDVISDIEVSNENRKSSTMNSPFRQNNHHQYIQYKLFVCNLRGEYISEIKPVENFRHPQSLAIDPIHSWLYWSEYIPEEIISLNSSANSSHQNSIRYTHRSIIVRARMDGSEQAILVDSKIEPKLANQSVSLQVDFYENGTRLYWINLGSRSIHYIDFEDRFRIHTIFPNDESSLAKYPTSLSIYRSTLFVFFHDDDGYVRTMDKTSALLDRKIFLENEDLLSLKIYDAQVQTFNYSRNFCTEKKGGCAHLCLMVSERRRKCLCAIGFRIDPSDETKCLGDQVFMMYSWNWGLRGIPITPLNDTESLAKQFDRKRNQSKEFSLLPPISSILMASSIDFDSVNERIYWSDSDEGSISRIGRDTSGHHRLLSNNEKLIDFALDWNAGNLYWIEDRFGGLIEVMRLETESRLVIMSQGIIKPTSLAVHPGLGYLIWSDVGHREAIRIERARLDGSNRKVIYEMNKNHTINDLALDLISHKIYFADLSEQTIVQLPIEEIPENILPFKASVIVLSRVRSPISLSVYDRFLYWADTNQYGGGIFAVRLDRFLNGAHLVMSPNMTGVTLLECNLGDNIKDISVYYKRPLYPQNQCARKNGGCEDLCFYLGPKNSHRCACSYGYVSKQDNRSCLQYDTFLIFSRINQIDSVNINDHHHNQQSELHHSSTSASNINAPFRPIIHNNIRNVIGLTYDYHRQRIIYTDIQRGTINWCYFNGSDHQILLTKQGLIEGIFYDQESKFLYWTLNSNSSIFRMSLFETPSKPVVSSSRMNGLFDRKSFVIEKIVQLGNEDRPRGISLDACRSLVYWTNWNPKEPSIQRAHISGYGLQSIVTEGIRMPNAIVVDQSEQRFYWSDARLNKIEKCDMNGVECVVLIRDVPQHPFGLALFGSELFWTDWSAHAVFRCDKYTGTGVIAIRQNIARPMGVTVVERPSLNCLESSSNQNPCLISNGGCDDLCLWKNSSLQLPECRCSEGRVLNAKDGRRCSFINSSCSLERGEFECHRSGSCVPFELTCDGLANCPDGSDEHQLYCSRRVCPISNFHQCAGSYRCIPREKLCDGIVHCPDGSDEKQCDCSKQGKFRCHNGICIAGDLRCNFSPDCSDASDEFDCPNKPNCSNNSEISKLYDGQMVGCLRTSACIAVDWICDGQNDCWDNSDETHCLSSSSLSWLNRTTVGSKKFNNTASKSMNHNFNSSIECAEDQLHCGSNECISIIWGCDGNRDCLDGFDESPEFCRNNTCPIDYFRCNTTGKCIPREWVCDGEIDCSGGFDEVSDNLSNKTCLKNSTTSSTVPFVHRVCKHNEFQCRNFQCVHTKFFCDGLDDCGDGSDEPAEFCQRQASTRPKLCSPNEYRCKLKHKCISRSWICNGIRDCAGGDDESSELCSTSKNSSESSMNGFKCLRDHYTCNNGVCIEPSLVCNGANDCGDFSDENQCNINECESNLVCAQRCEDMPIGYRCSCYQGFEPQDGGRICKDINECEENVCSQICRNTIGSFVCSCIDGYQLDVEDNVSCRLANSTTKMNNHFEVKMLLTTNDGIYQMKPVERQNQRKDVHLVIGGLNNAVAVDYDWQENCIYWSEISALAAYIKRSCARSFNQSELKNEAEFLLNSSSVQILHSNILQNPDGIGVDWIGRNLYWCDKGKGTIEVSKLDGRFRRVLIRENLEEPRAIVLNSLEGLMFWTDWGERPYIGRAWMDGSEPKTILDESLGWPNALTIDFIRRKLYFADAKEDYIAMIDFDGRKRKIIIDQKTRFTEHIFALSYFESRLYWTDWHSSAVVSCSILNCTNQQLVPQIGFHRPMDLKVWHPYRQPFNLLPIDQASKNPCDSSNQPNQKCSALCLLRGQSDIGKHQNKLNAVCACPENYLLNSDNISCRSNCSHSEFVCNSTLKCIPFWWKCDTQDDCGDRSDEPSSCPPFHCNPGQFQCKTQQIKKQPECIVPMQICDGVRNCADGSDEFECDQHICMPNQFKCPRVGNVTAFCILASNRCDGVNDCQMGEDELDCGCPKSAFRCSNKKCISKDWECDGDDDCGDRSDEEARFCAQRSCGPLHFRCDSGRCIPYNWRCDGEADCPGHQDELDCGDHSVNESMACDENHFRCANNRCVQMFYRCDHDDDCGDGSDEANCTSSVCGEGEFRCDNGYKCIKNELRCDGEHNCLDMSDEYDCHYKCQPNEFQCPNGTLCLLDQWICDGDFDCFDGSDEENCSNTCLAKDFTCGNKQCIYGAWRCDGEKDCLDGSDEILEMCSKLACPPNKFRCSNGLCISKLRLCDGVDHCGGDGSDEIPELCQELNRECLSELKSNKNRFLCLNKHCIDSMLQCNGQDDCGDGSDEMDCGQSSNVLTFHSTNDNNCPFGLCSQTCVFKHKTLNHHHHLQEFFQSNKTINETHHNNNVSCSCSIGYTRLPISIIQSNDDTNSTKTKFNQLSTCQANGNQAALLVSSDSGFRIVNPYKNTVQELYNLFAFSFDSDLNFTFPLHNRSFISRIESFDVFYHANVSHIFWTNPHQKALYRIDVLYIDLLLNFSPDSFNRGRSSSNSTVSLKRSKITDPVTMVKNVGNARGVAVDWIAKYLYWIDSEIPSIALSTFDGKRTKTVLSGQPLEQPYDLVIDPINCYFFWTDWSQSSNIKIGRAQLDGTNFKSLVSNDIEWPLGLALDFEAQRLYYCDPKTAIIETIRIDGSDRRRVYTLHRFQQKPYRIDVWEDFLYVSTFPNHQVVKLNKFGFFQKNQKIVQLVQGVPKLNDLVIVQQYKQKINYSHPCFQQPAAAAAATTTTVNPCRHSGFLCVAQTPSVPVCLCPDGYEKKLSRLNEEECFEIKMRKTETEHESPESEIIKTKSQCSCLNGGQCRYGSNDEMLCECTPLYDGKFCEKFRCSGYCKNHGLCYIDMSNMTSLHSTPTSRGKARCMCLPGWVGQQCETKIQSCGENVEEDYCLNQGTCFVDPDSEKLRCNCPKNFSGSQCEVCHDLYCLNGGVCRLDSNGNSACICLSGFAGTHCELHLCSPKYCQNNGFCFIKRKKTVSEVETEEFIYDDRNIQFNCDCFDDFVGDRCTDFIGSTKPTPITTVSDVSASLDHLKSCQQLTCFNGGTCHQSPHHHPTCVCVYGYTGFQCERITENRIDHSTISSTEASSTRSTGTISEQNKSESSQHMVLYTISIVILIVLAALLMLRLQNSLRKKMQSELAFQHRRIPETTITPGGGGSVELCNVEIINPVFNMNSLINNDQELENQENKELIVDYLNTNFANPIYEYKKMLEKNKEETENLLENDIS